jgi:hypothetical protein
MSFAVGKEAFGFCDRCGFRYDLVELKKEFVKGIQQNLRVCPECWSADHPQNFIGTLRIDDPEALRDPRPDIGLDEINAFPPISVVVYGWWFQMSVGTVEVSTT